MSISMMKAVFDLPTSARVRAPERLLLLAIADQCNDQGVTIHGDTSYQNLADKCGMDRRSGIRLIKKFAEAGWIEVLRDRQRGSRVNQFRLHLERIGRGDKLSPPTSDSVSPAAGTDCHPPGDSQTTIGGDEDCHPDGDRALSPPSVPLTIPPERDQGQTASLSGDGVGKKTGGASSMLWAEQTAVVTLDHSTHLALASALYDRKRSPKGTTRQEYAAAIAGGLERGTFERADLRQWWDALGDGDHDARPVELVPALATLAKRRRMIDAEHREARRQRDERERSERAEAESQRGREVIEAMAESDPQRLAALTESILERMSIQAEGDTAEARGLAMQVRAMRQTMAHPADSRFWRTRIMAELEGGVA